MDDWLTIPQNRKSLPTGRLCVILALTVLLVVMSQARHGRSPDEVASVVPSR